MSDIICSTPETWRREINQAVRDFASAGASTEDTVRMFLTTMLREVGEALALDCSALIEMTGAAPTPVSGYSWCRTASEGDRPFESRDSVTLVRALSLERDAIVLRAGEDESGDPAFADLAAYLREAGVGVALVVPIWNGTRVSAVWLFGAFSAAYEWPEPVIEHLQTLGALVWTGAAGSRRDVAAVETSARVAQMPDRLRPAPPVRSVTPSAPNSFGDIIGESAALKNALALLEE